MAYDPVLDREMFRPKSKSKGVEDLRESEDPAVIARREQALAMIEMAKQKFDPANYQTLKEQDRPGVFRPVAVNMPAQQPTADTAMRMQQMANMGMRPIGMADGGDPADKIKPTIESPGIFERISRFMYPDGPQTMAVGPKAKYSLPDVGLRIGRKDQPGIVGEFKTNYVRPEFMAEPLSDEERAALEELKNRYGPEAAQKIFDEQQARYTEGGSRLTRGIRDLLDNPPSKSEIEQTIKTLKEQEDTAPRPDVEQRMYERRLADIEEQRRAARRAREENPVPGVFESSTREEVARAQAQQEAAVRKAVAGVGGSVPTRSEYQGGPLSGAAVSSGMGLTSLPTTQSAEDKVARSRTEGTLPYGKAPTSPSKTPEDIDKKYTTSLPDIKRDREDAFNMALMQAGLAMMAGKSSNALANIGEGGIAGLQAYASQLGQARARDLEERKLSMMEKYYGSRERASGIAAERLQQDYLEALSNARSKAAGKWLETVKGDPALSALQTKDPVAFEAKRKLFIDDQLQDFKNQFKTQVSIARNASPDPELTKTFEGFNNG